MGQINRKRMCIFFKLFNFFNLNSGGNGNEGIGRSDTDRWIIILSGFLRAEVIRVGLSPCLGIAQYHFIVVRDDRVGNREESGTRTIQATIKRIS